MPFDGFELLVCIYARPFRYSLSIGLACRKDGEIQFSYFQIVCVFFFHFGEWHNTYKQHGSSFGLLVEMCYVCQPLWSYFQCIRCFSHIIRCCIQFEHPKIIFGCRRIFCHLKKTETRVRYRYKSVLTFLQLHGEHAIKTNSTCRLTLNTNEL